MNKVNVVSVARRGDDELPTPRLWSVRPTVRELLRRATAARAEMEKQIVAARQARAERIITEIERAIHH